MSFSDPAMLMLGAGLLIVLIVGMTTLRSSGRRGDLLDASRPAGPAEPNLPKEIEPEVRRLISRGRKIEAIKLVRRSTTLDLKGAKELVERL